jgi:hypothetical protein
MVRVIPVKVQSSLVVIDLLRRGRKLLRTSKKFSNASSV